MLHSELLYLGRLSAVLKVCSLLIGTKSNVFMKNIKKNKTFPFIFHSYIFYVVIIGIFSFIYVHLLENL